VEQETRRWQLYSLLGDLPPRDRKIGVRKLSETEQPGFLLEKLELDLNGIEAVPAYFTRPAGARGRLPAVLYNHSHGGGYKIGKDELLNGREYIGQPPYAGFLASLGIAALCIDTWVFGERARWDELTAFKQLLWEGRVLWGMMVYDSLRAFDYLLTRNDVDGARIGTLGMSMGSSMAQWTAALETRVKVCVDICCLTDYQALIEDDGLRRHGIYYYVPGLLKYFTAGQINALITPRPHLGLAGEDDALTPRAGLDRIDAHLRKAYEEAGAASKWRLRRYPGVAHQETPAMRESIRQFLLAEL
jgi:dienelactone hydrolase